MNVCMYVCMTNGDDDEDEDDNGDVSCDDAQQSMSGFNDCVYYACIHKNLCNS